MKEKIQDKLSLLIAVFIILVIAYAGYRIFTRVNAKREIRNNIREIFIDYEIKDLKDIKIKIHSKSGYQSKISYNVELTSKKYDSLDYETQKEIIKYIKKIAFKGNNKKYSVYMVTIKSKNNIYTYKNTFRKNDKMYSNGIGETASSTASDIKEKIQEKIEEFIN